MCLRLAKKIEALSIKLHKYLKKCNITQPECPVTINEVEDVFFFSENK